MKKAGSVWEESGGALAELRQRAAARARIEEIARAHLERSSLPLALCRAVTIDGARLTIVADDGAQAAKLRWILRPLAAEINRERMPRGDIALTETRVKIGNPS